MEVLVLQDFMPVTKWPISCFEDNFKKAPDVYITDILIQLTNIEVFRPLIIQTHIF